MSQEVDAGFCQFISNVLLKERSLNPGFVPLFDKALVNGAACLGDNYENRNIRCFAYLPPPTEFLVRRKSGFEREVGDSLDLVEEHDQTEVAVRATKLGIDLQTVVGLKSASPLEVEKRSFTNGAKFPSDTANV